MVNVSPTNTPKEVENEKANPFARTNKIARSPTKSSGTNKEDEINMSQTEPNTPSGPSGPPGPKGSLRQITKRNVEAILNKGRGEMSCMEHAVQLTTELSKLVNSKTNIHSEIKALVSKVETAIKGAQREYQSLATLNAQQTVETTQGTETTPIKVTKKRTRTSPELVATPSQMKKPKNAQTTEKPPSEWKVVQGKSAKRKERQTKKVRPKADALIISAKEESSYADILKKVKTDPSLKGLGEQVVRMRRTRNGDILLELKPEEGAKSATFKPLMEEAIGEGATIRALSQEVTVEVNGIEEFATEEDLRASMKEQFNVEGEWTIRVRKAFRSTQIASVRLPVNDANKLLEKGKIKVGWSVCEIRMPQLMRCFKCSGFGHQAKNCKGEDRSKACWKCGVDGHKGKDCNKAAKCFLCSEADGRAHVAGSLKCKAYKEAVGKRGWK